MRIPVEEESSKILCINTPCGLYKFERLPFGVKISPAIFQQVMYTMLSGLDFSVVYSYDILMNSKSVVEHKHRVHKVFAKIQDYGFKIKKQNVLLSWKKIKYLGHIIDKDGWKPEPEQAAAIKNMPAPDNIASLQSFPGLANYYQVFIKNMHDLRAPLTSELFLSHYNLGLEIIVAGDASLYGVGACIKTNSSRVESLASC